MKSFHLSIPLSFHLSRHLLRILVLVFSKFWHGPRDPDKVVCDRAGFSVKNLCAPKIGKIDQEWAKNRVLNLLKTFAINFYWICSVIKTYMLCCCTNPTFGNILASEIWAKIFSTNWIAGFFNQPHLKNKSMKYPDFLHVDANSHKLKDDQKALR